MLANLAASATEEPAYPTSVRDPQVNNHPNSQTGETLIGANLREE
jgi:hypothetical protein